MASSHEPPAIRVISPSRKSTPQVRTRTSITNRQTEDEYQIPSYYETDQPHLSNAEYEEVPIVRQVENGRATIEHLPPLRTSSHKQLKATHHRQRSDGSVTIRSPAATPHGSKRHTRNISGPIDVSPISPQTSARPAAYDITTDPWNTPDQTTHTQQSPIDSFKSGVFTQESRRTQSVKHASQLQPLSLTVGLAIVSKGLVVIIPMIALPITLIAVIYHYQLPELRIKSPQIAIHDQRLSGSYYHVQVPATVLLILSALSGVAAVILTRTVMSLESYRSAASLLRILKSGVSERLPTIEQLDILIYTLQGRWSTLPKLFKNRRSQQRKRKPASLLRSAFLLFLGILILSVLIILADIWLHIATRAAVVLADTPGNNNAKEQLLSTGIIQDCQTLDGGGCLASDLDPGSVPLLSTETARIKLGLDRSPRMQLQSANDRGGNGSLMLLSQRNTLQNSNVPSASPLGYTQADYTASSFAARTQCEPVSQKCGLKDDDETITFDCSPVMKGIDFAQNFSKSDISATIQANTTFFTDNTFSKQVSYQDISNETLRFSAPVLYHATFVVAIERFSNATPTDSALIPFPLQPEDTVRSGSAMITLCNTTIYETIFLHQDDSVRVIENANPANTSVATPPLTALIRSGPDGIAYTPTMALLTSDSASDISNAYAIAMARSAMIYLSSMTEPRPALSQRIRRPVLVAKVPKSALFVLVGLDLLYAAVGVVMMALALGEGMRGEVVEMRKRMRAAGLVAGGWDMDQRSPRSDRTIGKV